MTKKYFIKIAEIIKNVKKEVSDPQGSNMIAYELCNYFTEINPKFDKDRFLTACNI